MASPGHYMLAVSADTLAAISTSTPLSFATQTQLRTAKSMRLGDRMWVVEPEALTALTAPAANHTCAARMNLRPEEVRELCCCYGLLCPCTPAVVARASCRPPCLSNPQIASIQFGAARGLFNPHTLAGTLVVDGVAASQITEWFPASLAVYKLASLPLYAISRLPMSVDTATSLNDAVLRMVL